MKDISELEVKYLLRQLCLYPHIKGYAYITKSVILVYQDPSFEMVTKTLYPKLARINKVDWRYVENVIRSAIDDTWNKIPANIKEKVFGFDTRPSNAIYIINIVKFLQCENSTSKRYYELYNDNRKRAIEMKENRENEIKYVLKQLGCSASYRGYRDLVAIISLLLNKENIYNIRFSDICQEISEYEKIPRSSIEKNVRTAIECTFHLVTPELKELIFGYIQPSDTPASKHYIYAVVDFLQDINNPVSRRYYELIERVQVN